MLGGHEAILTFTRYLCVNLARWRKAKNSFIRSQPSGFASFQYRVPVIQALKIEPHLPTSTSFLIDRLRT